MKIKKMLFGENIPDKNDPKYKELHEKNFQAGFRFAEKLRIDKVAVSIQKFAQNYPKIFLSIIFSFILFCLGINLYRISRTVQQSNVKVNVIKQQEHYLHQHIQRLDSQQTNTPESTQNIIPNK